MEVERSLEGCRAGLVGLPGNGLCTRMEKEGVSV